MLIVAAMAYITLLSEHATEAPRSPPQALSVGTKTYHILAGVDLRAALLGQSVFDPECPNTSGCTDRFSRDGHSYQQSSDRAPTLFGSYVVQRDRYCMTVNEHTWCKSLFRASDGTYVELRLESRAATPTPVKIVPFKEGG